MISCQEIWDMGPISRGKAFWNSQSSSHTPHILGSWPALIGEKEETQTSHCFWSSLQQSLCRGRPQSTRSDYLLIMISACRTSLFPLVDVYSYTLICFGDLPQYSFQGFLSFSLTHIHTHLILICLTASSPNGVCKLTQFYQHLHVFLKVHIFFLL